ncbi:MULTISPECIES: thiamine biosynthesis protein ThiF [unclassified Fibrobacter]|nr:MULTISPECIES: thiamine biosynthesis protein ThiF [unclassified Fibrobacter]OWV08093.1 thiamine biosynthesis protein ThiF [Fibrobacter sp. UWH3]
MEPRMPSREEMLSALVERQGAENVQKLQAATVAVCGLGGLGSNVAIALARAGVGKLILIDFDCVDVTNLHRQQYKASQVGVAKAVALPENLREIAPYIELESHQVRVTEENVMELVGTADVVVEAFDNAEAKAMLVNAVLENGKTLVAASGMAGFGDANSIQTRRVSKKFYLCGDGVSDVNDGVGLVAPRVMACAAHQAQTVVRLICGMEPK